MTTEKLLQRFRAADKAQKLIKLQEMLRILKGRLPMFEDIDAHLKTAGDGIEEAALIAYYSVIIKTAEYLESKKISEYEGFMKQLKDKEAKVHEQEESSLEDDLSSI